MSIAKRLIDLARSNLNALLEKAAETADPRRRLAEVPDDELEAELARRRAARDVEAKVSQAKARVDASRVTGDRAAREREAQARADRVHGERTQREQAAHAARERASRQAEAEVRQAKARAQAQSSSRKQAPPRGGNPDLARYYERLELPYGADFDQVKTAYRKLMRKYHPDLHGGSPEKLKAATEVAQALTQAYNELEKVLLGGPNRGR